MDKLIDNREFPKEMHQKEESSKNDKPSILFVVIILLAVLVIAFLVYRIFFMKKGIPEQKESYSPKEQVEVIENFDKSSQPLTEKERQEKIDVFFNN